MSDLMTKARTRFEVKSLDLDARTFTGLSSTWDEDLGGDIIHKGAFRGTLKEWKAGGGIIPLIDQHNYGSIRSVVGKLVEAKESDAGLETTFQVIEGPDGDEVLRRVNGGYVDGLSIGYEATKWEHEETEDSRYGVVRHLKEVKLREVSVVIWPMNPGATIAQAKAAIDGADAADLTDNDRRDLRVLASRIGTLLRPAPADPAPKAADEPADPDDATHAPPNAPPLVADAPKADENEPKEDGEPLYAYDEALQHRLLRLKTTTAHLRGKT